MLFAFSVEGRVGDLLEQDVRLTVDHPIALADDRLPDGLGQMALAGAGVDREKCIFATSDERGVARSKTRLRFIFLLKLKSKLSSVTCGSRNCACLRRRSSSRSPRRVSSSDTRQERKLMGAIGSAWACCRRVSSTAAMPRHYLKGRGRHGNARLGPVINLLTWYLLLTLFLAWGRFMPNHLIKAIGAEPGNVNTPESSNLILLVDDGPATRQVKRSTPAPNLAFNHTSVSCTSGYRCRVGDSSFVVQRVSWHAWCCLPWQMTHNVIKFCNESSPSLLRDLK